MSLDLPMTELPELPPAADITRRAKSNLAFAFAALPKERRSDAVTFYAFCRWVDDLADDDDLPVAIRRRLLERWKEGCEKGFGGMPEQRELELELDSVVERRGINRSHLAAIVEGMLDDLEPRRFAKIDDVEAYNWKVASCVGLVSIRIFGCENEGSEDYAVSLGQALQWTNILRDVGEDFRERRRVYLPQAQLARFMLSDRDLAAGQSDGRFQHLMGHLAQRARMHFQAAMTALPKEDEKALEAAEGMRRIYSALLDEMQRDGFKVFAKRYSLPKWKKLWLLFWRF